MLKRLLVLVLASALVLAAACGDDGGDDNGNNNGGGTPGATTVEGATSTVPPETSGSVDVDVTSASVGQTITVTGANWNGEGPVAFYLLTEEQSGDNQTAARAIANQETVKLGEADVAEDNSVSFEFTLDAALDIEGGGTLDVASGAELTVFALQGGSGSRAEPITVQ